MDGTGPMIEIVRLEPAFQRLFAFMWEAARGWDVREPLSAIPPEVDTPCGAKAGIVLCCIRHVGPCRRLD
jgi:hypothetical protein